jgi:hypothetical protein
MNFGNCASSLSQRYTDSCVVLPWLNYTITEAFLSIVHYYLGSCLANIADLHNYQNYPFHSTI